MSDRAPDLVVPVVGFRAWRIVGDRLHSPYIPCRWDGRDMHAVCFPANRSLTRGVGWLDGEHDAPHADCQCGVYAYHAPGTQRWYGEWHWVEGVVTVWGRIEAHRDGLRAEHARIQALAHPPRNEPERRRLVERIAEALAVPLVPWSGLADAAAQHGAPLPSRMLPGDTRAA